MDAWELSSALQQVLSGDASPLTDSAGDFLESVIYGDNLEEVQEIAGILLKAVLIQSAAS